jgi:hypothetical protein
MLSHSRLTAILDRFLPSRDILTLAETAGFMRRRRLVEPRPWLLVLIFASRERLSFSSLAARYGALTGHTLSKQAFRQKLLHAVPFMRQVVSDFLSLTMRRPPPGPGRPPKSHGRVTGIGRVLAVDSTVQTLNDDLQDEFPGFGGGAGSAGLRLHVTYDLTGDSVEHLDVTSVNVGEQAVLRRQLGELRPRDLLLADLGFFNPGFYRELSQKGGYFISKLPLHVVEAFGDEDGEGRFDLWRWLHGQKGERVECGLWLGASDEKLLVRVVARRLSRKDHRKRVSHLNEERRRKGQRLLTPQKTQRARWLVFITNLPKSDFPVPAIFDLYRLRWQIELVFKAFKSEAGLSRLSVYGRPEVLKVMLYARLLQALFAMITHREVQDQEADEVMCLRWCHCLAAIADAIALELSRRRNKKVAGLLLAIAHANCRRERRRRPTSRSRIEDWPKSGQRGESPGALPRRGIRETPGSKAGA